MCSVPLLSLKDVPFKETFYRSSDDDIPKDFYTPVLSVAVLYQRAVGYFCVSSISCILDGIEGLLKNGGKIQIITSPQLTESDAKEIETGYTEKEKLEKVEKILLSSFNELSNDEIKKLSYVSILIKYGVLDIKIAVQKHGIYHDKIGIVQDKFGNSILFSGSMNETRNGMTTNSEHFDVLKSWDAHDCKKIEEEKRFFEEVWNNQKESVISLDFPSAVKEKCLEFLPSQKEISENPEYKRITEHLKKNLEIQLKTFHLPDYFESRKYQDDAISNWASNNYVGIFDMATGTGKTLTAIAALHNLYQHKNYRLAVVIVCPYQHLVEQWVEDIENCGVYPIKGYSSSKQTYWKRHLKEDIKSFLSHASDFFCFVTTNNTFATKYVQEQLALLNEDSVLVVDEAHNIGANYYRDKLPSNIPYRLALSATIDRHKDTLGTNAIYDYFQKVCLTYSLKDAISSGMLTRYNYHPVVIYLNDQELDEYIDLTSKISKGISKKRGKIVLSEYAKSLLNKRARLIAGASSKISKLKEMILPYVKEKHILVYCGATTINSDPDEETNSFDSKQIDVVTKLLGIELNMKVARFTSQEDSEERQTIKKLFSEGERQVLVAIKCLDEGVNIPSIKTAFILASSTNPKEYIQRRGRVLRKFADKKYAEIFDFVTLPFSKASKYNNSELRQTTKGLVKREITRIKEFYNLAENPSESMELVMELMHLYEITADDLTDDGVEF